MKYQQSKTKDKVIFLASKNALHILNEFHI